MTLEDIGEGGEDDDALLCMTNLTTCQHHCIGGMCAFSGNWFFPNRTRVPCESEQWDLLEEGIYSCEIPDAMGVNKTMHIGVYSASSGEWSILLPNALT